MTMAILMRSCVTHVLHVPDNNALTAAYFIRQDSSRAEKNLRVYGLTSVGKKRSMLTTRYFAVPIGLDNEVMQTNFVYFLRRRRI